MSRALGRKTAYPSFGQRRGIRDFKSPDKPRLCSVRLFQLAVRLLRVAVRLFRPGVRLIQAAYHARSLALYATLGFQARESLACMQGSPIGLSFAGYPVRKAREADLDACDRVCAFVHGHHRSGEVADAIQQGTATVVEHEDRITGYASDLGFFGHAIGETKRDLMALIAAAVAFTGPGILVPMRNAALFQWCLEHRLRVVQVTTLMTIGLYSEPAGAHLPSILY